MKEKILVVTALVETSPQAIPLGAACIVSAINNSNLHNQYEAELFSFSLQDIQQSSEKEQLAALENPSFVCFSVFVWNYDFLARIATQVKKEKVSLNCYNFVSTQKRITEERNLMNTVAEKKKKSIHFTYEDIHKSQSKKSLLICSFFYSTKSRYNYLIILCIL